jgi:hypothetical protein
MRKALGKLLDSVNNDCSTIEVLRQMLVMCLLTGYSLPGLFLHKEY